MPMIVGNLLRGFGPVSGVVGSPPTEPILTVIDNGDGTATATISGGNSDSSNLIYTMGPDDADWTSSGSRTGNGNVTLTLSPGRYYAYVKATRNSQSVASFVVVFIMIGDSLAGLDHSPADIVRYLLVSLGYGTLPIDNTTWPIGVSMEPDKPDSCLTLSDTSGVIDGRAQKGGEVFEHHGLQVRCRSAVHPAGYAKMREIIVAMDEVIRQDIVTIDSSQYKVWSVSRRGGILGLGREVGASKRHLFTINAIVSLRKLN